VATFGIGPDRVAAAAILFTRLGVSEAPPAVPAAAAAGVVGASLPNARRGAAGSRPELLGSFSGSGGGAVRGGDMEEGSATGGSGAVASGASPGGSATARARAAAYGNKSLKRTSSSGDEAGAASSGVGGALAAARPRGGSLGPGAAPGAWRQARAVIEAALGPRDAAAWHQGLGWYSGMPFGRPTGGLLMFFQTVNAAERGAWLSPPPAPTARAQDSPYIAGVRVWRTQSAFMRIMVNFPPRPASSIFSPHPP
jgi:hypothetical protein